jgi:hypothetical protein
VPPLWTFHQSNLAYLTNNKVEHLLLQDIPYHLPRFPTSMAKPTDLLEFIYSSFETLITPAYWNPLPDTVNRENIRFQTPTQLLTAPATDMYFCKPTSHSYYSKTKLVCPPINKNICPPALYTQIIRSHALYVQTRNALHYYERLIAFIRLIQTNFYIQSHNTLYSPAHPSKMHTIDWRGLYGNLFHGQTGFDTILQCFRTNFQFHYDTYLQLCSKQTISSTYQPSITVTIPNPSSKARKRRHSSTSTDSSSTSQSTHNSVDPVHYKAFTTIWKQIQSLRQDIHHAKRQKRPDHGSRHGSC